MRHRLPWLGIVLVFSACDLKPAPRQQPAAAVPAPAAPAPDPDDLARACMEIGVRVANIVAANAADAVLKAQLEQERANTVTSVAEACMRGKWDAGLRRCYLTASTQPQIDACNARAPAPAPAAAPGRPTPGS